jgi:cyclopropane-fatty-acyl-phospholipid synthase
VERLLEALFSRAVDKGTLEIVTSKGARLRVGDGTGEPVVIRFADKGAEIGVLADPDVRIGELYMDGRLTIEDGRVYDFIHLLMSGRVRSMPPLHMRALDKTRIAMRRIRQRNSAERARRNVAHHYDLDSRLYRLFLDPDMQYSCAYFEHPGQTLADAQLAKRRHIAAKLSIEPTSRVLDIGCGWGGLGLYLAGVSGAASVTGITLSEEQLAIAKKRAVDSAMADRVRFELCDYRQLDATFDRIVSVGMFEHVGVPYYPAFFEACARMLAPDGVMLLHTIGCSDGAGFVTPWLDKYIFPGGYIPGLSEIVPEVEKAGLIISDIEILQLHYAETLKAWRANFQARRQEAEALYDERFCRMWEFYLAGSEAAFRCEKLNVFQIQLMKEPAKAPTTRDYIAVREHELKRAETAIRPLAAQ